MTVRLRAAIVALVAALACGFLGSRVSEAPPGALDFNEPQSPINLLLQYGERGRDTDVIAFTSRSWH